jgi:hypothetical protein
MRGEQVRCGLDIALEVGGGKWKSLLLWELQQGLRVPIPEMCCHRHVPALPADVRRLKRAVAETTAAQAKNADSFGVVRIGV